MLLALSMVPLAGCFGGDGGGGGGDDDDDDGGTVDGVAHVVQGATAPPALQLTGAPLLPADGGWTVSPDQVRVSITRLNFQGAAPEASTGSDFIDCVVTYDRSAPSLSSLLDCPFAIAPGTYTSMNLFTDPIVEILISDAVNGIFTDLDSATGLSTVAPVGGADLVPVTTEFGGGFEQFFTSALVVGTADSLSVSFVVDAVHTAQITVSGSGTTLEFGNYFPARVFPTLGTPGVPQYYSSAGTADNYNGSIVLAHMVRVYFEAGADAQPVRASFDQLAGPLNPCQAGAFGYVFPGDPDVSPPSSSGDRAGGWLGLDPTDTLCGALGSDSTFSGYQSYFTMPYAANVGDSTLLTCELTSTPTPPSSGTTYEAGCPAMVAVLSSASLMLVAD